MDGVHLCTYPICLFRPTIVISIWGCRCQIEVPRIVQTSPYADGLIVCVTNCKKADLRTALAFCLLFSGFPWVLCTHTRRPHT